MCSIIFQQTRTVVLDFHILFQPEIFTTPFPVLSAGTTTTTTTSTTTTTITTTSQKQARILECFDAIRNRVVPGVTGMPSKDTTASSYRRGNFEGCVFVLVRIEWSIK